mgnify:CR=1 FL=1
MQASSLSFVYLIKFCAKFNKINKRNAMCASVGQVCEQGASSWLNALPLEKHGFILNKAEFRDAIALR